MRFCSLLAVLIGILCSPIQASDFVDLSAESLRDKIRGGLLGQMLGNLNGLPHEMEYIHEPGDVRGYVPALPEGAQTDDDTDFEWVYVVEMQRRGELMLSTADIATLWRQRINRRIWCSNLYARQLMDLGIEPPWTGSVALNPWAEFNISGQFLCETFALMAPGMPQTAARLGLNYTTVAIGGEPAQTTQLFTAMIATAFLKSDIQTILDAGVSAVDPRSDILSIVHNVQEWHREKPDDWRQTRARIQERYTRHGGALRDSNGYELNTAATIAALLHGQGDFAETLRIAFNLGWDCDNTAATAGTILGIVCGYRWMLAEGWVIVDRYRNTTRDEMPNDETITSFADRLIDLSELVITQQGGERIASGAQPIYRIRREDPQPVAPLTDLSQQTEALRLKFAADLERALQHGPTDGDRARAVYLATCLDLAGSLKAAHPEAWLRGVTALTDQANVLQVLFHHSPVPGATPLRLKFRQAGIPGPAERR